MPSHSPVLITDLDNTLYDWIDYFGPCFRAMVDELSSAADVDPDELHRQFQAVYSRHRAPEYRWAIRELDFLRSRRPDEVNDLVWSGFSAFVRSRSKHLRLYPGVRNTLETLRERGFTVIGVSNAPIREVLRRVRCLRLQEQLDALVAWEGAHSGDRHLAHRSTPAGLALRTFTDAKQKPSTHPYTEALRHFAPQDHGKVLVVGDSVANDLVPGSSIGAVTVWARYGSGYAPENYATVRRLSFWKPEKLKDVYDSEVMEPDAVIDDFTQLLPIAESHVPMSDGITRRRQWEAVPAGPA
ncbi:HAD family hydrolase [Streptomyces ferrugineus]|uniref:HAD family hydrolase n=1 Tax=Streptomyces ferrugineus TaxID=1413221 RepID=A0A7M2SXL5_9ACTN|nr:HAD family hydrolase [Streptomyces ferrugineus]QOV40263.1 HAD family hydrolase [Streptomyces ferrugineus]